MANQTGKRYVCGKCGSEMLVTRGGNGELACCEQLMQPRGAAGAQGSQPATQGGARG